MSELTVEQRAEWREELEVSEEMYVDFPVEDFLALLGALDDADKALATAEEHAKGAGDGFALMTDKAASLAVRNSELARDLQSLRNEIQEYAAWVPDDRPVRKIRADLVALGSSEKEN